MEGRQKYKWQSCYPGKSAHLPENALSVVSTDIFTYRHLPREVDPLVYNMSIEDPGDVSYNQVGGLGEQIRELREVGS